MKIGHSPLGIDRRKLVSSLALLLDDIFAANRTPEGQRAQAEIVEHEKRFLQLPSLQFFLGEEHVFVEPGMA